MRKIHGEEIYGTNVDPQTRCAHYKSELDVIAIKFKCCGRWFPCFECHAENGDHRAEVWQINEYERRVVLCGICGHQLSIAEYLGCESTCPNCQCSFNPGCARHYNLYFEISH